MSMLTMTFDGGGSDESPLARFSWAEAVTAWADSTAPTVTAALKAEAPVGKTSPQPGRLRDSIRYEREVDLSEGLATLTWAAYVPYANYVLDGTRAHTITAKAARALHWTGSDGSSNFAVTVHNPGTKANPFNVRAITPLIDVLQGQFREAVLEAMEE